MTTWLQDAMGKKERKPAFCISRHFDPDSGGAKRPFHTTHLAKPPYATAILPLRKSVKSSRVPLVSLILLQQAFRKTE